MSTDPAVAALQNAVSTLVQQVSGLQNQINKSSSTQTTNNVNAYVPAWTQLAPFQTLVISGAAIAWTPLNLSGIVPNNALWAILNVWTDFATPNNTDVELQFRQNSSGVVIVGAKSHSVSGSYTVASAGIVLVPLTGTQTLDYQITGGSFTSAWIRLVGYLA